MQQEAPETAIEPWKLALIRRRALRRGFRGADLDDAQQEIAIELLGLTFDVDNGASERTVVTAVIDRRLAMLRRRDRRYRRRFEQPAETDEEPVSGEPPPAECAALALDVHTAVAGLSAEDRELCRRLGAGQSIAHIAQQTGRGWHAVRRRVARLRERFVELGLTDGGVQ